MAVLQDSRTCGPGAPPNAGTDPAPAALASTDARLRPAPDARFARGALIGLLLVAPFWCLVALGLWWLFG
jgi:hypothetical protein